MDHSLLAEIDIFLSRHSMSEAKFGVLAVKDWKFVRELRGDNREKPRRLWPETAARVRLFMAGYDPEHAGSVRAEAA